MEKEIESILSINRYLINNKNNVKKAELVRGYLTSKVGSVLASTKSQNDFVSRVLSFPLGLLSF